MTKKVFILIEDSSSGAGRKFARAAIQLGLRPVILARDPSRMEYTAADGVEAIKIDTTDIAAVTDVCERLKRTSGIAGITTASESFYSTAATLCRHFGMPGPDPDAIERCRDKFLQRQVLTEAGVPTPIFRLGRNAATTKGFAAEIGLPVIVKPVLGTASRGVRLCRNLAEVGEHTDFLLSGGHGLPPKPMVLVEEFARGPFYTVSTIGDEVAAISSAEFSELPFFAMRQFKFPARLMNDEKDSIASVAIRSLRALGLGWGPANTEIRVTNRGPVVIEVNPRIVGAPEPELIRLAYGFDLFTETVKLFLGLQPELRRTCSYAAAMRWLMVERDGLLERVDGLHEARAVPGITSVEMHVEPGTSLNWHGDFRDVIGHVFAVTPSAERTDAALHQALDRIKFSVSPLSSQDDQERLVGTG